MPDEPNPPPDVRVPDAKAAVPSPGGVTPEPPPSFLDTLNKDTPTSRWVQRIVFAVGFALGLGCLALLGAVVLEVLGFPVFLPPSGLGQRVLIGTTDEDSPEEVYFNPPWTEADARRLGACLQKAGYFSGRGTGGTVKLDREGTTNVVSFLLGSPEVCKSPHILEYFTARHADLKRDAFDGGPLEVRLCSKARNNRGAVVFHVEHVIPDQP